MAIEGEKDGTPHLVLFFSLHFDSFGADKGADDALASETSFRSSKKGCFSAWAAEMRLAGSYCSND